MVDEGVEGGPKDSVHDQRTIAGKAECPGQILVKRPSGVELEALHGWSRGALVARLLVEPLFGNQSRDFHLYYQLVDFLVACPL